MSKYSLETHFRIYDNDEGEYIEVAPDGEADCCRISWEGQEMFLSDEQVELLIKALHGYLDTRPKP